MGFPSGDVLMNTFLSIVHTLCNRLSSFLMLASLTKFLLWVVRFSLRKMCLACTLAAVEASGNS